MKSSGSIFYFFLKLAPVENGINEMRCEKRVSRVHACSHHHHDSDESHERKLAIYHHPHHFDYFVHIASVCVAVALTSALALFTTLSHHKKALLVDSRDKYVFGDASSLYSLSLSLPLCITLYKYIYLLLLLS